MTQPQHFGGSGLTNRDGEFAYVTTNSITQGQPVPALFEPLYREGWSIKFAHRTFAWDSEAPGKAAVHCVIVGFTRDRQTKRQLWEYADPKGDPQAQKVEVGINAYLIDAPEVLVKKTSKPLSPVLPKVTKGSQATDGGNLVFDAKDGTNGLDQDPVASKYLRRFVGAREMLHNIERWCLWLPELTPEDLRAAPEIKRRLDAVAEVRAASKKQATQEAASTPGLFTEVRQPAVPYLCIPSVVSEQRRYWLASRYDTDVIVSNLAFWAPDQDGLLFALVSSSMFMTWQRAIGGRLESRLRFSNTLSWNTFPVPQLSDDTRERVIAAGRKVLEARGERPEMSLADLYDPYLMGQHTSLQKAHDGLDGEVDRMFGAPRRLTSDKQRLELLFPAYQQLKETS